MTRTNLLLTLSMVTLIVGGWAFGAHAKGGPEGPQIALDKNRVPLAAPEAAVDHVAYNAQKKAIATLKNLARTRQGKPGEDRLLFRLGELQYQQSELAHRIAHAEAYYAQRPINLKEYEELLRGAIESLNKLITRYPSFKEIPVARLYRAGAYEDTGKMKKALQDYHFLVRNHPKIPEIAIAYKALADHAGIKENYKKQVYYLSFVKVKPRDPDFEEITNKKAWAHFNNKQVDKAFKHVRRLLDFYDLKIRSGNKDVSEIARASRDALLLTSTLFFMNGYELKNPKYRISKATRFFKDLAGKDYRSNLTPMMVEFTKYVKAYGGPKELELWKEIILKDRQLRYEAYQVWVFVFGFHVARKEVAKYRDDMDELASLVKDLRGKMPESKGAKGEDLPEFIEAERQLQMASEGVLKRIKKIKKNQKKARVSMQLLLVDIYDSMLMILPEKDHRRLVIDYNVAEIYLDMKDYTKASRYFTRIYDDWDTYDHSKVKSKVKREDVGVRALGSRFESIKEMKLNVTKIEPKSFEKDNPRKLAKPAAKWAGLVEDFVENFPKNKEVDLYLYELLRMRYVRGQIKETVEEMEKFIKERPKSRYTLPLANLVMDTYLRTEEWEDTYNVANGFLGSPKLGHSAKERKEFFARVKKISGDAYFKMTEEKFNDKDYEGVLKYADSLNKGDLSKDRRKDMLNLVAKSAVALGNSAQATKYLSSLINLAPNSSYAHSALLLRGAEAEKARDFKAAGRDYQRYLLLPVKGKRDTKKMDAVRSKIVTFALMSGSVTEMRRVHDDRKICNGRLAKTCGRYLALTVLKQVGNVNASRVIAEAKSRIGRAKSGEEKVLWRLALLDANGPRMGVEQRLKEAQFIAVNWPKLGGVERFSSIPNLMRALPRAYKNSRGQVARMAPMAADKGRITRRVGLIKKVEGTAKPVLKLPWVNIRAQVLSQVGGMYRDAGQQLETLRTPAGMNKSDTKVYRQTLRGIAAPLHENGKKYQASAFELASEEGVEDGSFSPIAQSYFKNDPSKMEELSPKSFPEVGALDVKTLGKLDPDGGWDKVAQGKVKGNPDLALRKQWWDSLKSGNWPAVSMLMDEVRAQEEGDETRATLMQLVALYRAGAQAEALSQLSEVLGELEDDEAKDYGRVVLISHYMGSLSKDKVEDHYDDLEDVEDLKLSKAERKTVRVAKAWLGKGGS